MMRMGFWMVDVESRTKLGKNIEAFLDGTIDSFALDDVIFELNDEDTAVRQIGQQMMLFLDECSRRRNIGKHRLSQNIESIIQRWIKLLETDCEWPETPLKALPRHRKSLLGAVFDWLKRSGGEVPKWIENEYWPFQCAEEWRFLGN